MHWHQKMVLDLFTFVEKNGEPERPDYVSKDMMKQWFAKISKIFKTEIITKVSSYFYTLAKMKAERRGVIILLAGASGTGKSTLTSLLAGQLNIRPMSSDTIR
jgi:2-phosphoglycerate kinase